MTRSKSRTSSFRVLGYSLISLSIHLPMYPSISPLIYWHPHFLPRCFVSGCCKLGLGGSLFSNSVWLRTGTSYSNPCPCAGCGTHCELRRLSLGACVQSSAGIFIAFGQQCLLPPDLVYIQTDACFCLSISSAFLLSLSFSPSSSLCFIPSLSLLSYHLGFPTRVFIQHMPLPAPAHWSSLSCGRQMLTKMEERGA